MPSNPSAITVLQAALAAVARYCQPTRGPASARSGGGRPVNQADDLVVRVDAGGPGPIPARDHAARQGRPRHPDRLVEGW